MALITQGREKKRLGELLINSGVLTEEQINEALIGQKQTNLKLGEYLITRGLISEEQLIEVLAQQTRYKTVELTNVVFDRNILHDIVDFDVLKKHIALPFEKINGVIQVAVFDVQDDRALQDIKISIKCPVKFWLAPKKQILIYLDKYYGTLAQQSIVNQYSNERRLENRKEETEEIDDTNLESSIVKLVNQLLERAARLRTSDIHIEALEEDIRIRYRIDGDLHEMAKYPINMIKPISSRLKIMGGMDIAESRKPQDGRITYWVDGVEYDIRVSILPTVYGEKTVMRLAEKKALQRKKSDLGFNAEDLRKFDSIISNPHGIILVTGPTGSGKSTTLYTALSELNKENVNIITVEDPVEANINGINQVQVNNKAELSFASALRSILRQDPDIIMIGEIRDQETASIAVQASITGHLVVSTLHTNSAISTITRLSNMGIENYLIADSTVGIIAQRLVKRLCTCKKMVPASKSVKDILGVNQDEDLNVYEACGCEKCNMSGYRGRIGVYEILPITTRMKYKIAEGAKAEELEKVATEEGLQTLKMSATRLVKEGITDINELLRIAHSNG